MWGGSVAEGLSFLAEGRGAVCNHPDPMGCALPVLETPSCLTSCTPRCSTRLCGSWGVLVECDSAQENRGAGGSRGSEACWLRSGAQWGRVDVCQLARVLLALLACRVAPAGPGNAAGEAGMATTGAVLRRRRRRAELPGTRALIAIGAAPMPSCKASPIAPFHRLCCLLTNTASSGTVETQKEPSREHPSSTAEAQMYIYVFLNVNSCTFGTSKYHFAQQTFIPCSLITQVREHNRKN